MSTRRDTRLRTLKAEPPLTQEEIDGWVESLGADNVARIVLLKELIRYAVGDRMTAEDKTICMSALRKLQDQDRKEKCLPPMVRQTRYFKKAIRSDNNEAITRPSNTALGALGDEAKRHDARRSHRVHPKVSTSSQKSYVRSSLQGAEAISVE